MAYAKLTRKMKRFSSQLGIFEILTITLIIIYLYYLVSLLRHSKDGKTITEPLFAISRRTTPKQNEFNETTTSHVSKPPEVHCTVTVAIILCEEDRYLVLKNKTELSNHSHPIAKDFSRQINQTLVLLKSIAILSKYEGHSGCTEVLLISDKVDHYLQIIHELEKWSEDFRKFIKVTQIPVKYPAGSEWMRKMFRPCATLRLFLAEVLPADKWSTLIYLDTDIIFFQSVQSLWTIFDRFNKNHNGRKHAKVAAMAPCLFHYGSIANSVPYFGSSGLNAGIMLMNISRMREGQWTNKIKMVTGLFQDKIKLADQDILNIYFHFFPKELHLLTCDWNFRPFQCRSGSVCEDPEISQGISALHGNALSFTPQGPEPLFYTVFRHFHHAKLDKNFDLKQFLYSLESALLKTEETLRIQNSPCKKYGGFDVLVLNRLYSLAGGR